VPVSGQTARLIPQAEVDYAVSDDSENVYMIPRRDGMVVQEWSAGDYDNDREVASLDATRSEAGTAWAAARSACITPRATG
jgi:hypothetical protein